MDNVKKNKALKILRHTSLLQFFLITLLLILGGVAINHHGDVTSGIPTYYTGVFIVSPMAFVTATLGLAIYLRGRKCFNKVVTEQKIGCLVRTYCISLPFNWLLIFIGVLIVAFTGICTVSECSYRKNTGGNFRLAVTMVIIILLIFVSDVAGLILICLYANEFGVKLFARGQRRIANSVTESQQTSVYRLTTNDQTFITNFQTRNQTSQQHVQINRSNSNAQSRQIQMFQQQRPATSHPEPVFPVNANRSPREVVITSSRMMNIQSKISPNEQYQMAQSPSVGESNHQHLVQHTPHRKKKKRKRMRPSHPDYPGQGTTYVLPPIINRGQPPPPPSPPPPPNTPPPPSSDSFDTEPSAPPPYFINEHVDHIHDLPPPYVP